MFKKKTVLITGGTGSWGHELTGYLLKKEKVKSIKIFSRGEYKQVTMGQKFNHDPRLKFIIGDVRDYTLLNHAAKEVDIIFHLAAQKHVPVCEDNGWHTVLVNVIGTQNVIETAVENRVEKVIYVSTDKAVEPFNLYGITKACGERLIVNANKYFNSETCFICIRAGNVIGTRGSVIPLFKNQIKSGNEITLTDERMTRFFTSTKEAIGLIVRAANDGMGGEIFVFKMPGASNKVLCKVLIGLFGNQKTKIKKIGIRPGEKIDEVLISRNEVPYTRIINRELMVILPQLKRDGLANKYIKYKPADFEEFNSRNTRQLTEVEIKKLLIQEGY